MPVLAFDNNYMGRAKAAQAMRPYAINLAGPLASQRLIDEAHTEGVAAAQKASEFRDAIAASEALTDAYKAAVYDHLAKAATAGYSASDFYTDVDESDGALLLPPSPPARTNDEVIADVAFAMSVDEALVPTEEAVLAQYGAR